MKKYIKAILAASLILNISLIGLILYSKRAGLRNSIEKIINTKTVSSTKESMPILESKLIAMNNVPIPLFVDTCNSQNKKHIKVLIVGNSLSYHGIAKEIGWDHISGMAATSKEKDYAHLLFRKIELKASQRRICLRIANFASFERRPDLLDRKSLDSLIDFNPDIVIFQLGENVIDDKTALILFEKKYIELIHFFKIRHNRIIICTSPFFPSLHKNKIIENVTLSTNTFLVDLSHLPLLESKNYAKNEAKYVGNKSLWSAEGIGVHPGDIGMENIANQIFIPINALLSNTR